MIFSALLALSALGAPSVPTPEVDVLLGAVRVVGTEPLVTVTVRTAEGREVTLRGELVEELRNLGSLKAEVLGRMEGGQLVVKEYRLIDVGGGVKPWVGELIRVGDKLALRDGGAEPILLAMNQRAFQRLTPMVGGKVWIAGDKLVSGELKVSRYGILRKPKEVSQTREAPPGAAGTVGAPK